MMSGDDVACINADELRWRVLCLCRQINPVGPIISHLRQFPGGLCPETQSWFVNKCIDESLTAHFPRSLDFERKLLRAVVLAVESDGHELTEDLMSAFSKRLITDTERNNNSCSQWSYKLYTYTSDARTIVDTNRKIEQNILENAAATVAATPTPPTAQGDDRSGLLALHVSNDMLAGETGCWDWEAGFFLSEFIFNHPDLFRGKNILELGSGCGMAGVALARVAAASVVCTDGDVEALDNCLQNLRINGLQVDEAAAAPAALNSSEGAMEIQKIQVQRLRWEDDAANLFNTSSSIDIVLGADLTYDPVNIPPLIKILKEILLFEANNDKSNDNNSKNDQGAVVYIATTRRSEATFQTFLDALDAEPELQVEDVSSIDTVTDSNCVRFCHVESLEAARGRIVLHRITACPNLV